jgi:hypothetical protein
MAIPVNRAMQMLVSPAGFSASIRADGNQTKKPGMWPGSF